MPDLYFNTDGDIEVGPNGDLAVTQDSWRDFSQQAYIGVMTPKGDFTLYPYIGTELEKLYGMAQTPETGEYGKQLILDALGKMKKFVGMPITVHAVPTGLQTIRFDIYITAGGTTEVVLSIEQPLGF